MQIKVAQMGLKHQQQPHLKAVVDLVEAAEAVDLVAEVVDLVEVVGRAAKR